jgi:hypothetical protein
VPCRHEELTRKAKSVTYVISQEKKDRRVNDRQAKEKEKVM